MGTAKSSPCHPIGARSETIEASANRDGQYAKKNDGHRSPPRVTVVFSLALDVIEPRTHVTGALR
jgi:hypothetical protein